ncbi:MAG: AsmA-like C-terminal region-containing protein [Hyphomicrobiaceae bacterium]
MPITRTYPRTAPHQDAGPDRPRSLLWRVLVRPMTACGYVALILLPLCLLGLGLVYLKLRNGPISLGFLVPPIERALNAELPELRVSVHDAVLRLSERGGLEFRLAAVKLRDKRNRVIASARLAGVELSTRALWKGVIAPARIELLEPTMFLTHDAQGRLSLKTEPPAATAASPPAAMPPGQAKSPRAPQAEAAGAPIAIRVEAAQAITAMLANMRAGREAAAHLRSVGMRDATILIQGDGRLDELKVEALDLGLEHRHKRSNVAINARIAARGAPWTLKVRIEEATKAQTLALDAEFSGLVPRLMTHSLSSLPALSGIDVALSGTASAELDTDGDVRNAKLEIKSKPGEIFLAWLEGVPLPVEESTLRLGFEGQGRVLTLEPSRFQFKGGHVTLQGVARPASDKAAAQRWTFDVASVDGMLTSQQPGARPIPITGVKARGHIGPEPGRIDLETLRINAGNAEVVMAGQIAETSQLQGRISPMPLATLLALWPDALAPRTRTFAATHISAGEISGGNFKVGSGARTDPTRRDQADRTLSLTLEAADVDVVPRAGLPPIHLPRALLRTEGTSVELAVPEGALRTDGGRTVTLKGGRVTIVDIDKPRPLAEMAFKAQAPLAGVAELLTSEAINLVKDVAIPLTRIDGKAELDLRLSVPLGETTGPTDIKMTGKARILDGRIKDVIGPHDLSGAALNIAFTDKAVDVTGQGLLGGVLAKVAGQWNIGADEANATPLRVTARLDNADRTQLGLDLADLLQGDVPLELTVHRQPDGNIRVGVLADLTSAELMLEELRWRKPVGRPARATFDVAKGRQGKGLELQNFKVTADNIAIDGWVEIGPDNKPRRYYFPEFSLNVVSNLEVQGTLRPDHVWEIKARGKSYEAGDLFRSFFAIAQKTPARPKRRNPPGLDISADFDSVLGVNDTVLRQVRFRARKRGEDMAMIDLRGVLDGGHPLTARMTPQAGRPRILHIETQDAGQAFRLIGFYPNMVGGHGRLDLDLDVHGAVERAGTIKVRRFKVLGDPVVAEVFQNMDDAGRPAISRSVPSRRVVREQFDFESFDAAFAVGNAQVVIENATARGPLIGASVRGKLDFKAQRMQLGGTYVPLSGLNRAIGVIPVIGQILTGPRGEGVLGITYAIEGPLSNPQVIVNPLSMVAPGIIREIFQMTPQNVRVTPSAETPSGLPRGKPRTRSSPAINAPGDADLGANAPAAVLDGWVSTTTPPGRKKH